MAPKAEELLSPYLAGESPRDNGDIDAHCPLHHDRRRSAVINFEKGVWYCNTEGDGGSIPELIARQDEWVPPPTGLRVRTRAKRTKAPSALPSEEQLKAWHDALMGDMIALEDLKAARGLWTGTAEAFEIGWDRGAQAYTIPVRDRSGRLLNVRRYQLRPPKGRRKIWGVEGHNAPALYPWSAIRKATDYIIICEGEWDALACNQHNFRTVTRTGSATTWRGEWSKLFKDKVVYICHDADVSGQAANRKVARSVAPFAKEVRIIRLPYPVTAKDGKDLTDWWLDHDSDTRAFQRLMEEAGLFDETMSEDPEEIDPSPAAVVDAFDARRAGKPLALTVTIKGKRGPGYTVPRRIEYRCTLDAGELCQGCPMRLEEGSMDRVIAGADPLILEMCDATKTAMTTVLRSSLRIPKCARLNVNVVEHQSVEILFARPSVEHAANGAGHENDASDYANIKLTSVGRHDTNPNQTVRVVGALHPDPRKQLNEFLTWDVAKLETSLDRFDMDSETYKSLLRFQPAAGEKPLAKLRSIADDLAANVTVIYGRPELHAAMDLVYHSVLSFDFDGKRIRRGWLDLLVVGDTRTGKSEIAQRLTSFYAAGEVVSCESASYAGVVGGLQQFGATKEWAVTWGVLPLNDRRLVVLDEISGLTPEEIAAMSSIRSSGIAELVKIQQERTNARTRLIWLGNPRGVSMGAYAYGVQAIAPLIGNPEDIARFDLAMSVASGDVPASVINQARRAGRHEYPREACSTLVRWAWSRTPEQVTWEDGATEAVYKAALDLGRRYVEDPPLIQAANVREKVARLAVAVAARLFSTDERGEVVRVRPIHVKAAVSFIDRLYSLEGFGYADRSREIIADRRAARNPRNIAATRKLLEARPGLTRFLRAQGKFRRQDLEEILNIDREEANAIVSTLMTLKMVYKQKGDTLVMPTLNEILREEAR